ncbi:hypothetical protein KIL84_023298 [Mauremys mutica]|uniref:Protein YIPF n=1 Tax=Mauremys mutica TaxID=74926 RepID=A0A9D3WPS3_9SAUR|nr:hypothetical protein KIL84_023298 [Mauremys mutica]
MDTRANDAISTRAARADEVLNPSPRRISGKRGSGAKMAEAEESRAGGAAKPLGIFGVLWCCVCHLHCKYLLSFYVRMEEGISDMSWMLQGGSADSKEDGGPQFAEVFVIIWFGAVVITLNSKLLGGTISFFQSLCVLGYCVLPLTVAMLVCRLVLLASSGTVSFIVRLVVVMAMFGWSTLASTAFLADSQPPNRKALVVYPIFLFYFVISWMILTFTPQ